MKDYTGAPGEAGVAAQLVHHAQKRGAEALQLQLQLGLPRRLASPTTDAASTRALLAFCIRIASVFSHLFTFSFSPSLLFICSTFFLFIYITFSLYFLACKWLVFPRLVQHRLDLLFCQRCVHTSNIVIPQIRAFIVERFALEKFFRVPRIETLVILGLRRRAFGRKRYRHAVAHSESSPLGLKTSHRKCPFLQIPPPTTTPVYPVLLLNA